MYEVIYRGFNSIYKDRFGTCLVYPSVCYHPGGSSMAAWWIHTMSSLFNVLNSAGVICRRIWGIPWKPQEIE